MLISALLASLLISAPPEGNYRWDPDSSAWNGAHLAGPLSAAETRQFMRELGQYVFDHHLKQTAGSPQRGMVYEYFNLARQGQVDQYLQGEALDTMHDGAWLAAGLASAYRATGERFYRDFLVQWMLPFYLKMLNHSDELFDAERNDARPTAIPWGKEWKHHSKQKGFVPYYWDDGGSVSVERRFDKNPLGIKPCVDFLAGKPNPNFLLDGYSLGMSNHMAQDLGVMLQQAWLLLRQSPDAADRGLAEQTAEAARNLHANRVAHGSFIPMCVAPAALASRDAELMKRVPAADDPKYWIPHNAYVRALYQAPAGQTVHLPGFADDQEYQYYYGLAKTGGKIPPALAFRLIYDAFTNRLLYRYYCDDAPAPAGINRFDLHPYGCRDGKLADYRSDRKGPFQRQRPIGSRMGPQNMVVCGWALQLLRSQPGVWEEVWRRQFSADLRVLIHDPAPGTKPTMPPMAAVDLPGASVALGSTRDALVLETPLPPNELTVEVFSRPGRQGAHAVVRVSASGEVAATNDRGSKLQVHLQRGESGRLRIELPYTVVKSQALWANGVEHCRYSIALGGKSRDFYLASSEQQVRDHLEHELGAGLRTWQAIRNHCGYIPTGLGNGSLPIAPGASWDQCSDSGGYAHLITAAAQWLRCLEAKSDWDGMF